MNNLINKLEEGKKLIIKDKEYIIKTKTWYSIEEDSTSKYIKCELSNDKVLVVIPDDELIYIGQVIKNMKYEKISENELKYNNDIYNKTGEGHQYITNIEFGNKEDIEGKCIFEDFEFKNNVISLGFLTEKNQRADVYADIINKEHIKVKDF